MNHLIDYPEPPSKRWSKEIYALLGKVLDRIIAARLGVHPTTVMSARIKRGIPPPPGQQRGRPKRIPRLSAKAMAILRTHSIARTAEILGYSRSTVTSLRQHHDIPPPRLRRGKQIHLTRAQIKQLGTKSDAKLARQWGLCTSTVFTQRRQRGIAPFKKQTGGRPPRLVQRSAIASSSP